MSSKSKKKHAKAQAAKAAKKGSAAVRQEKQQAKARKRPAAPVPGARQAAITNVRAFPEQVPAHAPVDINAGVNSIVGAVPVTKVTPIRKPVAMVAVIDPVAATVDAITDTVVAATPRKRTRKPLPCGCGCGDLTKGGKFIPGHDSKLYADCRKLEDEEIELTDITHEGRREAVRAYMKSGSVAHRHASGHKIQGLNPEPESRS